MKYLLHVEQFIDNANYAAELEAWNQRQKRNVYEPERWRDEPMPAPERKARVLEVELTEAEWLAVKKAALEAMG